MCVIYIAIDQHPDYPLILLANRDEYYSRASLAADFWHDFPGVYAGRDLEAGGTWLGVTMSGRLAALTNYRDPHAPHGNVSRGELVAEYLKSDEEPRDYLERVRQASSSYSGFNLIVGSLSDRNKRLFYCSNRADGIVQLKEGIYGLSNHLLDTPWPKVKKGKNQLKSLLNAENVNDEKFFKLLADETRADDSDLPPTGIPIEAERALSSVFIRTPDYGTRCSTLVKFDSAGSLTLEERIADTGERPASGP